MKIEKMQINAFGNIENKQIQLSKNINIVKGNNESGKSTILKFIVDMFYGISKNKRGKEFSDYERYKPWNGEEFSGKIYYELDNGVKYEIFRDFNKKNPKIYDEELNDISKEFTIDKTNGNQFFVEQTKIDETTFLSTFVSCQSEVKLEKQEQNTLVQRLANLAGTGDDNVSYKKAIDKINKKQIEEIGTLRTSGRPMNIIKNQKYKLQDEIGELEEYKDKQYEIEENRNSIQEEIIQSEAKLVMLSKLKQILDKEKIEKEKINFHKKMLSSDQEKVDNLIVEKEKLESKLKERNIKREVSKEKPDNSKNIILLIILIISLISTIVFIKNVTIAAIMGSIFIIDSIVLAICVIKNNKSIRIKQNEKTQEMQIKERQIVELKNNIDKINMQIEMLQKSNEEKIDEIKIQTQVLDNALEEKRKEYNIIDSNFNGDIRLEIEELQNRVNKDKLTLHSLELDKNNIMPKVDKLAIMEEELEELNEKESELLKRNESMELAKQILEVAYTKMKESVTPKFTENLSKNIEKICNGKYKNIRINDEEGIIVEKENGEYISAEKLSIGTIDQLYLSLRFGAIKEISEEAMPIILDEAFAYYDEERLKNILKYLNEEFKENQIIIFTCTNREKNILEKENIEYNLINL